jgi:hypothetical protein
MASVLALCGCAAAARPVAEYSACERACRYTHDHCSDDSAKERQTGTSCAQDLGECLDLCDAQAQGDPSDREQISKRRSEAAFIEGKINAGRAPPPRQ